MKDEFMTRLTDLKEITELDRLGIQLAARERVERRFGIRREQIIPGRITSLEPLEDLLRRDQQREKDGFPKKIRFRRILGASGKVIVVPNVEEEKLVHGEFQPKNMVTKLAQSLDEPEPDIGEITGHGEGEVGDIIDEAPLGRGAGEDDGDGNDGRGDKPGPGAGDTPGEHGFEEEAYEIGKKLTERLQLPNLREKRKKVPSEEYIYDLTDRHEGSGQVLDEEETLSRILETNFILGRVDKHNLDTQKMLVGPEDEVYRVLSRERVWKSQAMVFFLRDYSGSMLGDPTRSLVDQHMMIYAWLLVQYEKRVIPRFIVHDTHAREVAARQYFRFISGGGTLISSGYQKVNEIVEGEGLENDYNIYVFQGTDGDDSEYGGERALAEIKKILRYTNRMGVTLFKHPYFQDRKTTFEEYMEKENIPSRRDVFRLHIMSGHNVTEEQNIEAFKALIAQD